MSALFEYKKFLLDNQLLNNNEKKIARLILDDFDTIKSKSKSSGSRSKYISQHLKNKINNLSEDLSNVKLIESETTKIKKLTKLIVSNFRGFQEKHSFDLSKKNSFIFGENGSGKSSFFEALEYSLTGDVSEASGKRIDLKNYIRNSETGKIGYAKVFIENNGGESILSHDFSKNSSILIEKNRIEGFSRVSSYTKSVQQEQLSILFGTDNFSNFCTNFTSLSNYLLPSETFSKKVEMLERELHSNKLLQNGSVNDIGRMSCKGKSIVKSSGFDNETSSSLLEQLISTEDKAGLIDEKRKKLEKLNSVKLKETSSIESFGKALDKIKTIINQIESNQQIVSKFKDKISIKSLYEYIIQTELLLDNTRCPACQSLIKDSNGNLLLDSDPFQYAKLMGKELQEIKEKEDALRRAKSDFKNTIGLFNSSLARLNAISSIKLPESIKYSSYNEVKSNLDVFSTYYDFASNDILSCNEKLQKSAILKVSLKKKIHELELLKTNLTEVRANYKSALEQNRAVTIKIENIAKEITKLKPNLEAEIKENKKLSDLSESYNSFILKLKEYNENLPIELAKELSDTTLELYNSINKHSFNHELIKKLSLPSKPNEYISIEFLDGTKDNALKILSEGHLKCLGLSILLAKNIKDKQTVLIFDDVVNAIDDEHRSGIRETLINNEKLDSHQLILTTHAPEFLSFLENMIPEYANNVTRYDFCNKSDGRKVSLKVTSTSNLMVRARKCFDSNDYRDCLMNLRRVLEFLAPEIWKKIIKKNFDAKLSMQFFSPELIPNLSSYLEALRKKTDTINKKDDTKTLQRFVLLLSEIIDLYEKNKLTKVYLNKGTHFDDKNEEFDTNVIEKILSSIEELNKITLAK